MSERVRGTKVETAHTPGPWKTGREDFDSFVEVEGGELERVVYVYRGGQQPRIGVLAGPLDNAREDARLIAAAPEMLEALLDIWPYLELDESADLTAYNDAVRAIAKVLGREPHAAH